jgi:hypothetical protein
LSVEHILHIHDRDGTRLDTLGDVVSLDVVRAENEIGPMVLTIPGDWPESLFGVDRMIVFERGIDGGKPGLYAETLWLMREWNQIYNAGLWQWEVYGECLNSLLARRIVDYNPNNNYTDKVEAADAMGIEIVRENMGDLALDSTRTLASAYFRTQTGKAAAPVLRRNFARRNVLKTLQEITQASLESGTYLVFDVVCVQPPRNGGDMLFELRTYIRQRGKDHRNPGGKDGPLSIGPDFKNMDNLKRTRSFKDEVTRAIAVGPGVDDIQAVDRVQDDARRNASPFNLTEDTVNAGGESDPAGMAAMAQATLRKRRPKNLLTGDMLDVGLVYDDDWKWGDYLTAQLKGSSFDCHAERVQLKWDSEGDKIKVLLRAETS